MWQVNIIRLCISFQVRFARTLLPRRGRPYVSRHGLNRIFTGSPTNFEAIQNVSLLVVENRSNGSFISGYGWMSTLNNTKALFEGRVILTNEVDRAYVAIRDWQDFGALAVIVGFGLNDEAIGFVECALTAQMHFLLCWTLLTSVSCRRYSRL